MNKILSVFITLVLILLTACNGSSGENTNPNNEAPIATSLSLTLLNDENISQQSFESNETITIKATVYDQFSHPISGARVDFIADLGELSLTSKLTDSSGVAIVNITNPEITSGAGTATASIDTISANKSYEFVSSANVPVATNITIELLNDQNVSQQSFENNESITVKATVLDQFDQPISGSLVSFSTELGELSLESKLTNALGVATVEINNPSFSAGAGTVVISTDLLTIEKNYEYLSTNVAVLLPSIQVQLKLNGNTTNKFKANEQVQIEATLLNNEQSPLANEIINFTADFGLLNSTTALTNENGVASVVLAGDETIGAGIVTASFAEDSSISNRLNYQILPSDSAVVDDIRIGYFNSSGEFIEGKVQLSIDDNTISAGATLGLSIDIIDSENNRINTPITISFTSNCVLNSHANIDETVFSVKGRASATFEDIDCAGVSGTEDVIIASITANDVTITASAEINILGEQLGSIEYVSADPTAIVIKGSGGKETSTLTFLLKSALGNPLAQQNVDFSLDSSIGGIALSRTSGLTNSNGMITTQVSAGSVPTVVRVTAKSTMDFEGQSISVQTQSSELSVNTGLPDQASITIAASVLNPEASTRGEESIITAWLADSFNNPVPDGTTVNFTTEGGTIDSSCNTIAGNCFVTWKATEPYLTDHRATILATASGHETFFDSNGDNIFDDKDGNAINNAQVDSGLGRQTPLSSGFVDMQEAWRDDNENNIKDALETKYFDDNGNGAHDIADKKFNGPQCDGNKCDSNAKRATIRKSLVLIMSEANNPNFVLSSRNEKTVYQNNFGDSIELPTITNGILELRFRFADSAMQTMPFNTSVSITIDDQEVKGVTSLTVGNTNKDGYTTMDFYIEGGGASFATLSITIGTPNTSPKLYINKKVTFQ